MTQAAIDDDVATPASRARALVVRAAEAAASRQPAEAERLACQAEELLDAEPEGWSSLDAATVDQLFVLIAQAANQRGDAIRLLEVAIKAHRYNPSSGPAPAYQTHLRLLAYIELEQGDLAAAAQYRMAFDWRSPVGGASDTVSASLLSRLLAADGDYAGAYTAGELAVQLAPGADDPRALDTYRAFVPLCFATGHQGRAAEIGSQIEAIIARGHEPEAIDHIILSSVAIARGDHPAAAHHMAQAQALFNPPYTTRAEASFDLLRAVILTNSGRGAESLTLLTDPASNVGMHQDLYRYSLLAQVNAATSAGDAKALVAALKSIDASLEPQQRRQRSAREAELRAELAALIDDDYTAVLEELLWQKSEVQRIVLHDLNGGLAACQAAIDLLSIRDAATSRDAIVRSIESVQVTVENLSVLTSLDQGQFEPQDDLVHVGEAVHRLCLSLQALAGRRGIVIVDGTTLNRSDIHIAVDNRLLHMALFNLLSNALKYCDPGSTVTISATIEQPDNHVVISVIDDGPGIPPSEHETIFLRHIRGSLADKRGDNGLGLGLYIARACCSLNGMTLSVASAGNGTGSRFDVTIPATKVRAA